MLDIANTAGDGGLAQTIIWQVLDQYDDDAEWLITVAKNELAHNKPENALGALIRALAIELNNAEAKTPRAQIIGSKAEAGIKTLER